MEIYIEFNAVLIDFRKSLISSSGMLMFRLMNFSLKLRLSGRFHHLSSR